MASQIINDKVYHPMKQVALKLEIQGDRKVMKTALGDGALLVTALWCNENGLKLEDYLSPPLLQRVKVLVQRIKQIE